MYKGTYYWFAKKLLFPSPRLRGVVFRGWNAHRAGHRQRLLDELTRSYFFASGMSTKKKFKKNANTLVSLENSFWIPVVSVAGGVDINPIITAHQEIVIENSVRYIELLKSEASKILDEYWKAWKARNQLLSQTTYANGGRFISSRFAPVLRKVGSSQKLTIVWKDFSPRFKNKIKHHGVVVKPVLVGYSVSCFKNTLD